MRDDGAGATGDAGLPLLRSIRELQRGGDRIHAIAGVLSGSLAWLFDRYDGLRPFSGLVRQAREAGYTEPDPRQDLSGEDVRRKISILARAAGVALERDAVDVASLLTTELRDATPNAIDAALPSRRCASDTSPPTKTANACVSLRVWSTEKRESDWSRCLRITRSPAVAAPTIASRFGAIVIANSR
jgi:homoserine dehydrogenase